MNLGFPVLKVLGALVLGEVSARADALDNWTSGQVATNPIGYMGLMLSGVAVGNGRYVAVGQYVEDDCGVIQTSEDGASWTLRSPQNYSILDLYDVAFGNSTFVAVGWDWFGGANIYHSTNGIDWTSHYSAIGNIFRVIYGGGLFVAVGDGVLLQSGGVTNRNIYTSPDGITWTAQKSTVSTTDVQSIQDVAYGAGRYVAVDGANHFYTSTTGSTWSKTSNTSAGNRISYCNHVFIVPAGPGTNLLSADGLNWSPVTNNTAASFGRAIFADGCYLALSGSKVFTSTDGTNWIARAAQIPSNISFAAAAYSNRRFIAVGYAYLPTPALPAAYSSDPIVEANMSQGLPPKLKVSGIAGRAYRIDQLDDLRSGNWQTATNFTLSNSPSIWTDLQAAGSSRYYRAVLLP
jgi:hypothetical protein